jgi:hypothetical protein
VPLAGPQPGGPVQPRSGPRAHAAARAPGALARGHPTQPACGTTWWHAHRWPGGILADGPVVHSPTSRWWLADVKVFSASSWGPPGGHRATRAEVGLTEGGGRLRGRVAARWDGQQRLRLAPGAAGEDERRVGVPGAVTRGATGQSEGGWGSVSWTGTARTRRLWATPIVTGGACLAGVAATGQDGGAPRCGHNG